MQWADLKQNLTCEHQFVVCGYMEEEQNNWMITQYINISRTGVTELLLNATMYLPVNRFDCRGLCSDSVKIRVFQTNGPDELGRNVTSNYNGNVASLEATNPRTVESVDLVPIPISGLYSGLYLAIVDAPPGTCVDISRLALYYYVCPEQVVNLVKYPETVSPSLTSDFDVLLVANCADNAILSSSNDELQCSRRGRWKINDVVCSCIKGHYFSSDSCECKQFRQTYCALSICAHD